MRSALIILSTLSIIFGAVLLQQRAVESIGVLPDGDFPVRMNPISGLPHQEFIQMPANITLTLGALPGGIDRFTGPAPFVPVSQEDFDKEPITGVWTIEMGGTGTVAGNPNVGVTLTGNITPDGVFTGFYTMGSNNELPGGYPIVYRIKPKEATVTPPSAPTPTATPCPPVSGVAGQECPGPNPTPTRTPAPTATPVTPTPPNGTQDIDMGCEAHVQVTDNADIRGDADGIRLDCDTEYNPQDLQTGNPNAQTTFDTDENTVHVAPNGPILGQDSDGVAIDLDACTPVQVNFSMTSLSQALSTQCKLIIKAFGSLGSGNSAGSELLATYESDPFTLNANALFPPFGSGWDAPGVHATLRNTATQEVAGYISDFGFDVSPYGDVNCNFVANSVDAALVLQLVAALVLSQPCQIAGDVDGNFHINAIDASLILQYGAGLLDELPP